MTCPKCGASVETSEWTTPTRGAVAKAIFLDWRTWALSFVVMALSALIADSIGFRTGGVGGGAVIGMFVAIRMGRLRVCPKCAAVVDPTP